MRPHRGGTILTLGILGLLVCAPLGIGAWFMADDDLQRMKSGTMDPSGRDITNAGRICGMVATGMFVLQVIIICLVLVGGLLSSSR
jgi:hypothetical protein